jgi:hypothetical protein
VKLFLIGTCIALIVISIVGWQLENFRLRQIEMQHHVHSR